MKNPLMQATAAFVLALTWVIAAQQLIYSKELPGEGFTAGALLLLGLLLVQIALGYHAAGQQFPPKALHVGLVSGLAVLAFLAFAPTLSAQSMLTSFDVPVPGGKVSSTLLFDGSLFLIIVCSTLLAVNSIHQVTP